MEFAEDSMSGNEFYDLLDVKMWRNKYVFLFMYMLIQLSLKTGYTHGDHHLDNFMVNTKDKTYIKGMTARPIIIDFGRSTKIPPPEMDEIKRLCSEHNYNDVLQMLCKKPVANEYVSNPQYLKSHYGWGCGIPNDNQMMTTYVITELNENLTNLFQLRERQIDINISKMNQMHEQEPDKYPLLPLSNAEKNKLFGGLIGGFRKRRNYNKKRNVTRRRRFTKRRARKTHNRRARNGY
jgi:predicted unusual protein kinase regulating ubiquinone biosynthesis (AarF/ABC1/UbiB family)